MLRHEWSCADPCVCWQRRPEGSGNSIATDWRCSVKSGRRFATPPGRRGHARIAAVAATAETLSTNLAQMESWRMRGTRSGI